MRVDLEAFERTYRATGDPWGFTSSPYETRKYELTVASLPGRRYDRCFEPGCSIGALTERLADVAADVIALDASATAADAARKRVRDRPHVSVGVGSIPELWPEGTFDLIVFSEIGYYWDEPELAAITWRARLCLRPDGHFVGVHWLGRSPDHLLHGSAVHRVLASVLGEAVVRHHEPAFMLEVWQQP